MTTSQPFVAAAAVVLLLAGSSLCLAERASSFRPRPTLVQDLEELELKLKPGYADKHPRLLFSAEDREALRKKAAAHPKLWAQVIASAGRLGSKAPDEEEIRTGAHYWRIERVQSGALAWVVTGEKRHFDAAVRWMVPYCREKVWGDGQWRPNIDLHASWYLYHMSLAYDMFYNELSDADRKTIRDGLADHARAIYESVAPEVAAPYRYDQNHTYIPVTGMLTAALVLLDDVPEARDWLERGYAIMRRSRYALGEDGYYYEGFGYWTYALHWHVRYADLMGRATGEKTFELPVLRENWRFALYMGLPGSPNAFDVGDSGRWSGARRPAATRGPNNTAMLWGIAKALNLPESKMVADMVAARWPEGDYPAAAFLWFAPRVEGAALEQVKPYHHFKDHDVVSWRSGWDDGATCYLFRCGPPQGHRATSKLKEMKDWTMNSGHTHPDIGAFWIYAKGEYLAVDTGYTANKWTRDHSTLLIDGLGQGVDGSYHNERGVPYEHFDKARIDRVFLSDDYGFASGQFGSAYTRQVKGVSLRRTLLMTKGYLLVVDDMAADQAHKLTWLCQAYAPFQKEGAAMVARPEGAQAALAVMALTEAPTVNKSEKTIVFYGPVDRGTEVHRGYHLDITMNEPAQKARLINLLVPLRSGEKLPGVKLNWPEENVLRLRIEWPSRRETVLVNLDWHQEAGGEPAQIEVR